MKPVPVYFLSLCNLSLSMFLCHTRCAHTQQMGRTGLFSPVYRHTAITLNCPVTFQKFSCHMEPSQGQKDAEYVSFSIKYHFKMPPQITYRIYCISSYKRSCHGPLRFSDCVSKFLFPLNDSLIFQHCLWNKSMQSSSWR